ncbi:MULTISPECIES: hypothetical protein [Streptomyces]|uniref:Uncharacterized protein n=1 Tax=Streptomyces stelliscabiei TaxID=146820 RepID=A0A8I0NWX5_9ACTN|nr:MULTISPECIES: hypothetical protein [Streptomyces]KND46363.1 hypothetical protein IQ64_01695 [Streptomyces stelliscabiei]MBE1595196.1 hypothetical protein [Streptomyces stelliscabiei]MDX2516157.1 hypothetical protein [Streptomyces stelliscabiei]MDX2553129.1 hypothetical protein [Streptomyces stelliscabiei]MDX2612117.1 hypothetical protein [Streptomyces stelliscabiei]
MNRARWGGDSDYQIWARTLDRWADGDRTDPLHLPPLAADSLPADTWQRLLTRIAAAVDRRLQSGLDLMVREVNDATDEFSVGRALTRGRDVLRSVRAVITHTSLPADFRQRMAGLMDEHTRRLQEELERGVRSLLAEGADPHAVETRRRTLRDNPLTAVLSEPSGPPPVGWYEPTGGRRIVTPD